MKDATLLPNAPGTPRPAASLLVIRERAGATEVLMARRGAGARFMPGVLVFPGGAVDDEDFHATVATPLRPSVLIRLQRSAEPRLAHAFGVAAARELMEEVGLSLGTPPELAGLDYLCRAITPPDRTIRFDARFFIVAEDRVAGTPTATVELEDPAWYSVEAALAQQLALATRAILGQFTKWRAHQHKDGPVPVLSERRWLEE